ncbi:MAG: cytochrome c biogenesis protein CcdA [Candidatus Burarchaeum sp.]|nr:cytochrome c biogenesis protein CcdA [Candidatus Burarchaeum sp.]MDO8339716.1 cytochrome c biogenesis protein CcdA [Candidatus Burarchaeum sp.]
MDFVTLAIAYALGILSFLSPCIIPMIIVYITTVTGLSLEELAGAGGAGMKGSGAKAGQAELKKKEGRELRRRLLLRTVAFVASFTLVFTLVGGAAGYAGTMLAQYFNGLSVLTGAIFIVFSLHLLGLLHLPLSHSRGLGSIGRLLACFRHEKGGLNYLGVFIVGLFFALVCSHCIGPTLYSILALAASTASAGEGMALLFAFSLGLGLPFILTALFFGRALEYLQLAKRHVRLISLAMGIILLLFGIVLITGNYVALVSLFYSIIPWRIPGM